MGRMRRSDDRAQYGRTGGHPVQSRDADFFQRFLGAVKAEKVALISCMCKLLILTKQHDEKRSALGSAYLHFLTPRTVALLARDGHPRRPDLECSSPALDPLRKVSSGPSDSCSACDL